MQAMDDMALLREYATHNSETAFEELVTRRIGFVYSAALRQVREPLLAEEITQAVFILLAQKAGKISGQSILTGWLFKATRFTALAQIRAAAKRSLRTAAIEKELQMQTEFQSAGAGEIWNQMSPLLDEALAALGEKDRQAVLLRFFENKSLAEVGSSLGICEDTARKRVSRALEKLHHYFNRRGISSTTAIIAGEISANSVQAAPVALVKSVTAVAVAKGATASALTLMLIKGALKLTAWAKMKSATLIGALLVACGAAVYVWEVPRASCNVLIDTPPQVKIVPTKYPDSPGSGAGINDKTLGISSPMKDLIADAYGLHDDLRLIIATKLPSGKYDYIANLASGSEKTLQQAIKRQFGIIGRFELRRKDVLVLKLKSATALRLIPRKHPWDKAGDWREENLWRWSGQPSDTFADSLEQFFQIPVVNQTGLTNLQDFTFDIKWDFTSRDPKKFEQALGEAGFELVPTNQPIEMLVVEKAEQNPRTSPIPTN